MSLKTELVDDGEAFLGELVFPEEEQRLFTTAVWSGGFRWFRSPNVVPIERYRDRRGDGQLRSVNAWSDPTT
jgi:hypothetical protein